MGVKVLTDSTSYITEDIRTELDIRMVSLNISFNDESMKETDISNENFYVKMKEKGIPTSSQPSIGELHAEMKKAVANGDSLLCVFLSSEMSGTYPSAFLVKDMILEEYKDAQIEIIDSKSNCMQLGFAAITAAQEAAEGKSLEEVKLATLENLNRTRFLFIPENLEYLKKGGRIGGASAILGNLLKIIPILTVENGKTTIMMKVRTKKNAITTMLDKVLKDVNLLGLKNIVVHHINCYDEALELVIRIKALLNVTAQIYDIGPVIGLHVGPGAIGIVYCTERDLR